MKKYTIKIVFEEGKNYMKMETYVDGKKSPMPPKLEKWIAREYVNKLFYKNA